MRAIHAVIHSYTASFRAPGMSAGYQITLPVPPLSTVFGLLAAALGHDADPESIWLGYRFHAEAEAEDLEKIIMFSPRGAEWDKKLGQVKTMPIRRQFLVHAVLHLYVSYDEKLMRALRAPRFPLSLGRSQDVATVQMLEECSLSPVVEGEIEGILLPFPVPGIQSFVYNLPTYLPTHPPRQPLAVKPFQAVVERQRVRLGEPILYCQEGQQLAIPLYTARGEPYRVAS